MPPVNYVAALTRENEQLKKLLALKEHELQEAGKWFEAFQRVDSWLLGQGLWGDEDIHATEPADTLIAGLTRTLALRDVRALQHFKNVLTGLQGKNAVYEKVGLDELFSLIKQGRLTPAESAPAPDETAAKKFIAFAQARRSYERWLQSTPTEEFAPATYEEVMTLYDRNCSPFLAGDGATPGDSSPALLPAVVADVVAQCQEAIGQLIAREGRSANVEGQVLLREAAAGLGRIAG